MGYQLAEVTLTFDITENGKVIELAAVNERIPPTPDSPQTGDTFPMALWLTVAGASFGAVLLLTLGRRKRTGNR